MNKTVKKASICLLLALLLVWGPVSAARAEPAAREVTDLCAYDLPSKVPAERLTDGSLLTRLTVRGGQTLTVSLPACHEPSLYMTWFARPEKVTLVQRDEAGRKLRTGVISPATPFERYELDPACRRVDLSAKENWTVSTLRVFDGELPEDLVCFGAPMDQADMLVLLGQPQALFEELGGLAPLYAGKLGLTTAFCFLSEDSAVTGATAGDPTPLGEAVDALWSLGCREAPFLGGFVDHDCNELEDVRRTWGTKALEAYLVRLIRTLRPTIVVSAAGGEADQRSAFVAARIENAVRLAANESQYPAAGPAYEVQKLYISDPSGGTAVSYEGVAGETAAAYRHVASRQFYKRALPQTGRFTLAYTAVGPDQAENDLMEHLDTAAFLSYTAPADAPEPAPEPTPNPGPAADPYPFLAYGEAERVETFDNAGGRWVYRSDILSVEIRREVQYVAEGRTKEPVTYYIAHVYTRDWDSFYPTFADDRKSGVVRAWPRDMALRYKSVIWFTGDNLIQAEAEAKGILIRDGRIYSKNRGSNAMAYYADTMTFRVVDKRDMTAMTLWESGTQNVFSFPLGADLIREGRLSAGSRAGTNRNPRCALGMVAPGHFVVLVADGRQPGYSVGFKLREVAELLLEEGCVEAFNLDGGISTSLYFLGVKLNHHLDEDGKGLNTVYQQRALPEGLAWGYSELCGTLEPATD